MLGSKWLDSPAPDSGQFSGHFVFLHPCQYSLYDSTLHASPFTEAYALYAAERMLPQSTHEYSYAQLNTSGMTALVSFYIDNWYSKLESRV